jgi:hypothetical protein
MSDDVESSLDVEVTCDRGATIVLVGEFDMTGTAPFWAHVSEALETQPPSIPSRLAVSRSSIHLAWRRCSVPVSRSRPGPRSVSDGRQLSFDGSLKLPASRICCLSPDEGGGRSNGCFGSVWHGWRRNRRPEGQAQLRCVSPSAVHGRVARIGRAC